MRTFIVYEDETSYNPIVYIKVIQNKDDLKNKVEEVLKYFHISTDDLTVEDIVNELDGSDSHLWLEEHWCLAIKRI